MKLIIVLLSIFSISHASDSSIFESIVISSTVSIISGFIGFLGSIIFLAPRVKRIHQCAQMATKTTKKFIKKYKNVLIEDIYSDIKNLLLTYDILLEEIASLLRKFKMNKEASFLENLIKEENL